MGKRTCSVDGCDRRHEASGYCPEHYQRWTRTGDPLARCRTCGTPVSSSKRHYCSDDCKPRCSVDGCGGAARKIGLCASHYAVFNKTGDVRPFAYKWAKLGQPCEVCGATTGSFRSRRYCSAACVAAASRYRRKSAGKMLPRELNGRPKSFNCRLCGRDVSIKSRGPNGRLQRADSIWCRDCGRDSIEARRFKKYGVTPEEYELMIADGCRICGATDRRYHIDHDHACCPTDKRCCGKCVRGALCGQCNQALGLFRDRDDLLLKAIEYLKRK